MVPEQPLHDRAQIGCRLQIAALVEVGVAKARPIGDDAPALQRAAGEQSDGRGPVVGAAVAIDVRGAAELGDRDDDRLAPGIAHIGRDRRHRVVERAQEIGEPPLDRTFIDMGVPAIKGERADARPVRPSEELRRRTRGLGEIGAYLRDATRLDDRAAIWGGPWSMPPACAIAATPMRSSSTRAKTGSVWR